MIHAALEIFARLGAATLIVVKLWALWLIAAPSIVLMDRALGVARVRGWIWPHVARDPEIKGYRGLLKAILPACFGAACQELDGEDERPQECQNGHLLILGRCDAADVALANAAARWDGGIIAIGRFGIAERLRLKGAAHFCPGRTNSVSLNPMFMIRAGLCAWRDAKILATGLLRDDGAAAEVLAALMFDQLATAPLAERNLAALRRRIREPSLRALHERTHVRVGDGAIAHPEIERVGRWIAGHQQEAEKAFADIARMLQPWSDGRLEAVTQGLDLKLSDVAAGDVRILVLEAPPGDELTYSRLFAALACQAVQQFTDYADADGWKREKRRPPLLIIEEAALVSVIPLLSQRLGDAKACGLTILIQAASINEAARLFQKDVEQSDGVAQSLLAEFDRVDVIGAQGATTAHALAKFGGASRRPHLHVDWPGGNWTRVLGWVLPGLVWVKANILSEAWLMRLPRGRMLRFWKRDRRPALKSFPIGKPAQSTTGQPLRAEHPWTEAPIPQNPRPIDIVRGPSKAPREEPQQQLALGDRVAQLAAATSKPRRTSPRKNA